MNSSLLSHPRCLLLLLCSFLIQQLAAQTPSFDSTAPIVQSEATGDTAQITVLSNDPAGNYTSVYLYFTPPAECNVPWIAETTELSWRQLPNETFSSFFGNNYCQIVFSAGQTSATCEIKYNPNFWGRVPYTVELVSSGQQQGMGTKREMYLQGNRTGDADVNPAITFSPNSFREGETSNFSANISEYIRSCATTYLITVTGGSATPGSDYIIPPSTPRIADQMFYSGSIVDYLNVLNDTEIEGPETVEFTMTVWVESPAPGIEPLTITSTGTFTILSDDLPVITVGAASLAEGAANASTTLTFPVTLAAPSSTTTSFAWRTQSGTAVAGADFTSASGTVSIPAGQTAASISVTVTGDNLPEADETFTLVLSSPNGVSLPSTPPVGTILDDDFPVLTVADASVTEGHNGTTALVFPISIPSPQGQAVSFSWAAVGISATPGVDFIAASGTAVLNPGQTQGSISITVNGDTSLERNETLLLEFSNGNGAQIPASATGTIVDDDFLTLTINEGNLPVIVPEGETGGYLPVTLSVSAFPLPGLSVRIDYTITSTGNRLGPSSGTITIPFSLRTRTINVWYNGNQILDPDEVVTLTLSNPVNLSLAGGSSFDVYRITDDDPLQVTVAGGSVTEGNSGTTALPFTVTIPAAHTTDLNFAYATTPGTASAGEDYVAVTGNATIPAGSTSVEIPVSVSGDTKLELTETFSLTLSNFSLLAVVAANTPGSIVTDDVAPAAVPAGTLVTEAAGADITQAWFAVNLPSALSIPYTCSVATRDGTALAGLDYRALPSTQITFAPGETRKWIAISVTASPDQESQELFYLDVTAADSGAVQSASCVIERLVITDFWRQTAGIFVVRFPTGLGQRYVVDRAETLKGPWIPTSSVLSGSGFPVDQFMFSATGKAYFRVRAAEPLPPGTASAGS